MKITALEPQKKSKTRYNLFIDEVFFEGVEENTIALLNLYKGKEVTAEFLEEIRRIELEERLHSRVLALVSRYRKTEKEVERYILERGYSVELARQEVSRLREYGFVDDAELVKDYLRYNEKESLRALRFKLTRKGIPGDLFDRIAAEFPLADREEKALERAAEKKYRSVKGKQEWREALFRYLMGKGFDAGQINALLDRMEKERKA
ncbi:MAG TPA: RecX family transcriptional regulator [Candidatus Mcinerneyibacteriales bacterium]|nr:RecX family transcriptional regulator [Candidatus Mcinerneyibacteriales bacterium]HPE20379.1 RecX family transcriptional regulator [Candidatus Mcinerneyibacteriales bacterium]HPJ70378.1 RecX family transcriptional regulator [Candidatus Mcinerneyibacteriales bacterium]HPQ89678.1 RecX family transcriptional regulator [Candidatus Mcinerneyibacteriales bacterium]